MWDFIRDLELEYLILFSIVGLTLFLVIVNVIKTQRALNLIGKRAFVLTEDLLFRDGVDVVDIMIANTSYVNVEAGALGFRYKKVLLPLKEESIMIIARDSHKISIPLDDLRTFVLGSSKRVKRVEIYAEDSLGRRTFRKAKNSMRELKKIMKSERKAERIEARNVRFETGNYRFLERVGLVFKWMFSPIYKLFRATKNVMNRKLKDRESKLEIKNLERAHQKEMRDLMDQERHEFLKVETEKRILEERQHAEIEARQNAIERREQLAKIVEAQKKADEEKGALEAEANAYEKEMERQKRESMNSLKQETEEKDDEEKEEKVEELTEEKEEKKVDEVVVEETKTDKK